MLWTRAKKFLGEIPIRDAFGMEKYVSEDEQYNIEMGSR